MKPKVVYLNVSDPHSEPTRACAGLDTAAFFPADFEEADVAARVCMDCPILARCAEWALRRGDLSDGVFASVWLPPMSARVQDKRIAEQRLRQVAETGLAWFADQQEVA